MLPIFTRLAAFAASYTSKDSLLTTGHGPFEEGAVYTNGLTISSLTHSEWQQSLAVTTVPH